MNSFSDDGATTISDLKRLVAEFVAEREWRQFHSPKNLSMALAIEAAELMEHFQWITADASRCANEKPEKLAEIGDELADVLGYVLALGNELDIDLATALQQKMIKNRQKYPADVFRGKYGKEDLID